MIARGGEEVRSSCKSRPDSCVGGSVVMSSGGAFKCLVLPGWFISMLREIRGVVKWHHSCPGT